MAPTRANPPPASSQLVPTSSSGKLKRTRDERDQQENDGRDGSYSTWRLPSPTPTHNSVYDPVAIPTSSKRPADSTEAGSHNFAGNSAWPSPLKHTSSSPRPVFKSRKSARLVSSDTRSEAMTVSPRSTPPRAMPEAPVVDDITIALGIGWKRVPEPQANAYKRIIEKQYQLQQVTVIAFWDSQSAYLAQANYDEGGTSAFFLLDERFDEGQRVGWSWEETLHRLTGRPMVPLEADAKVEHREPQVRRDSVTDDSYITESPQDGILDSNMEID